MSDLLDRVRALRREAARLAKRVGKIEEQFDRLVFELVAIEEAMSTSPHRSGSQRLVPRSSAQHERLLRHMAEAGVRSIAIKRHADDSASVQIDGGKWFSVTARLADLLTILSQRSDRAEDGLIARRSFDEVIVLLSAKSGHLVSKHAAVQLIWRLRQRLKEVGENPFLIEGCPRRGARFALRAAKEACDSDRP